MGRFDEYVSELDRLVRSRVGKALESVIYGTIENSCTALDVKEGIGWIGGEARLLFDGASLLYVGWGENDGWPDHFSLAIQETSTFKPNTLVAFSASTSPEWAPHVGKPLLGAICHGNNGTPHALILRFPSGSIVLADGHELSMGDGDDIVIQPLELADITELSDVIWSAGA